MEGDVEELRRKMRERFGGSSSAVVIGRFNEAAAELGLTLSQIGNALFLMADRVQESRSSLERIAELADKGRVSLPKMVESISRSREERMRPNQPFYVGALKKGKKR